MSTDDTPPRVWWSKSMAEEFGKFGLIDRDAHGWRVDYNGPVLAALPADAVELHPAPGPLTATGLVAAQAERIEALSRLLRGMEHRASRYRRKIHLAAQDASRHHAAAPETSDPTADDLDDDDDGHGPWFYTEFGVECSCRYPVDKDERCTRPRTPQGQHDALVGKLFEAADSLVEQVARHGLDAGSTGNYVHDLRAVRDELSEWGEANADWLASGGRVETVPAPSPSPAEVASRLSAAAEVCEKHRHHGLAYEFSQIASQLDEDGYSAQVCAAVAAALSGEVK